MDSHEQTDEDGTVISTWWHSWHECVVDECPGFEQSYTYTDEDGTEQEERWCDYSCMASGGHLSQEDGYCTWGDDLEDCLHVIYDWGDPMCDTWCAPNSGVRDPMNGGMCVWENIDHDM